MGSGVCGVKNVVEEQVGYDGDTNLRTLNNLCKKNNNVNNENNIKESNELITHVRPSQKEKVEEQNDIGNNQVGDEEIRTSQKGKSEKKISPKVSSSQNIDEVSKEDMDKENMEKGSKEVTPKSTVFIYVWNSINSIQQLEVDLKKADEKFGSLEEGIIVTDQKKVRGRKGHSDDFCNLFSHAYYDEKLTIPSVKDKYFVLWHYMGRKYFVTEDKDEAYQRYERLNKRCGRMIIHEGNLLEKGGDIDYYFKAALGQMWTILDDT